MSVSVASKWYLKSIRWKTVDLSCMETFWYVAYTTAAILRTSIMYDKRYCSQCISINSAKLWSTFGTLFNFINLVSEKCLMIRGAGFIPYRLSFVIHFIYNTHLSDTKYPNGNDAIISFMLSFWCMLVHSI